MIADAVTARPTLWDDWMAALCEWTAHQRGCPPCLTYDPTTRCPVGGQLFESEQAAHHAYFQARFGQEEVQAS